jgi:hypothetical protein
MRTVWPAAAIVFTLLASGCWETGGLSYDLAASRRDQERRAEAADHKDAEAKRERENAEIRETQTQLRREREATQAQRRPNENRVDAEPGLPQRLDPATISEAVAKVKTQVMSCRDRSSAKGQVLVLVKVAADGSVVDVTVTSAPHPALGSCVAVAMRQAIFARTRSGGSFRYPFVF